MYSTFFCACWKVHSCLIERIWWKIQIGRTFPWLYWHISKLFFCAQPLSPLFLGSTFHAVLTSTHDLCDPQPLQALDAHWLAWRWEVQELPMDFQAKPSFIAWSRWRVGYHHCPLHSLVWTDSTLLPSGSCCRWPHRVSQTVGSTGIWTWVAGTAAQHLNHLTTAAPHTLPNKKIWEIVPRYLLPQYPVLFCDAGSVGLSPWGYLEQLTLNKLVVCSNDGRKQNLEPAVSSWMMDRNLESVKCEQVNQQNLEPVKCEQANQQNLEPAAFKLDDGQKSGVG